MNIRLRPDSAMQIQPNPAPAGFEWIRYSPSQEYGLVSVFNKNTRRVLSYDVLWLQPMDLWPRGLCLGGLTSISGYYVEPVTNTSSSSCANNGDGRRRECSARRRPSQLYFSHFATRTVNNTVDLYAVIYVQNRVFCLPHLHLTPPLAGFPSEYRHPVWHGKTRMAWLRYLYSFWCNSQTWQTDTQTPNDGIGRAYAYHCMAKIQNHSWICWCVSKAIMCLLFSNTAASACTKVKKRISN